MQSISVMVCYFIFLWNLLLSLSEQSFLLKTLILSRYFELLSDSSIVFAKNKTSNKIQFSNDPEKISPLFKPNSLIIDLLIKNIMDRDQFFHIQKQFGKKKRKLSFKNIDYSDLDPSKTDDYSLKKYICSNVQSKRNNLLALYSNTITNPEHTQNCKTSEGPFATSITQEHKKIKQIGNLGKVTKIKYINSDDSGQEESLIVSSKFPIKAHQRQSPLKKIKLISVEESRTIEHRSTAKTALFKEEKKRKPPLPPLPEIQLKNSRRKVGRHFKNQINPWQYLVIPDHTVFSNA